MNTVEIGDLVGRILATTFLSVACIGGVWAVAEFVIYMMRWRRGKKYEK